jgi:putative SOS response-associated peptidase YedK
VNTVKEDRDFAITKVAHDFKPNYNISPTQDSPVIIPGSRILDVFRFGLIPQWAKDKSIGAKMTNARAETIMEKPSFQRPFTKQRCLVIASSFFEWSKDKSPFVFKVKGKKLFAMAGIWDKWDKEGKPVYSFSIITCEPNNIVGKVHHRMPVILNPKNYETYLTTENINKSLGLLKPFPDNNMISYETNRAANNSRNNFPDILNPVSDARQTTL